MSNINLRTFLFTATACLIAFLGSCSAQIPEANKTLIKPSPTASPITNTSLVASEPIILLGSADILSTDPATISVFEIVELPDSVPIEIKHYKFDLLNCAGYLATAESDFDPEKSQHTLTLIRSSIAADAGQKIERCKGNGSADDSVVFAVLVGAASRTNLVTPPLDVKKLITDLEPALAEARKDQPKEFLEKNPKAWADTDGDGQPDLVIYRAAKCGTDDECLWTMQKKDGRWKLLSRP